MADDFMELGGEGLNALVETETGDKFLTRVSNRRPRNGSAHDKNHADCKYNSYGGWSFKNLWSHSDRRQKPPGPAQNLEPLTRHSKSKPRDNVMDSARHAREAEIAQEQRRERFRAAKNSYVPLASKRTAPEMQYEPNRLNADVGKAVKEASRRSADCARRKRD